MGRSRAGRPWLAAEYRDLARGVPRATAIALVTVSVLYLALGATTIVVLGARRRATATHRCSTCWRSESGLRPVR
ncbi:MAG: hypothetical protein R2742_03565 [Micropruina glycogenica]